MEEKGRKRGWRWWDAILLIISLGLGAVCYYYVGVTRDQTQQIKEIEFTLHVKEQLLQERRDAWVYTYADLLQAQRETNFYKEYIGLVNEGDRTYHTYGCEDFDNSYFYAYNVDQAENRGYRPCQKCR